MTALECWYLPFSNISARQQILNEPSCESSYSFFFFLLVCLVGSQKPELAVFPIVQPHVRWCGWPGFRLFFPDQGFLFVKHRYTFHWKAQIRLLLLSVTIQINFYWLQSRRMWHLDLSFVKINRWFSDLRCLRVRARGKCPRQNLSDSIVWSAQ